MSAPPLEPPLPIKRIRPTPEIKFVFKVMTLGMDLQDLLNWTVQIAGEKREDDAEWCSALLALAQDIDRLQRSLVAQKLLLERELVETGKYAQTD